MERANSLTRKLEAWISIQHLYMPTVAPLRARQDSTNTSPVAVQDVKLFLPSSLPRGILSGINFFRYEWDFRYAQAEEELNSLRGFLLLRSHMLNSKQRFSRGQRQNTRSQKLLSNVDEKIRASVAKYRHIRLALDSLSGPLLETRWRETLRPLEEADVSGLSSMDNSGSEGRKRLSWIWKVHGTGANADECTQLALRIEWCKARARAHRWQEECVLLAEEMRRVIAFFQWQCRWWKAHMSNLSSTDDTLTEGRYAYAMRQANMRDEIGAHCEREWEDYRVKLVTMEGRDAYAMVECH
ncbi:unnamed protein product [Cyclocybe aegerita]|uniref:Uncharacterized protein n=1 Tax=Cyclocybe aegerita TaxID=1973307 RepID=A0A8S0X6F1_CYCAE|nr:unnamed protein product [Cyclocybe aegerita]